MQAIKAASSFFASGGTTGGASTTPGYSARGSAFQYAASGIVTSATMVNPSTIAGEQGNSLGEAVLPLARAADGSLGVQVAGGGGGSSGGGNATVNNVYQITVNAQGNQNPQAVATAVADRVKQIQKVSNTTIAKNLQQGGMLNPNTVAAF
jgi:phage-related minor tail protein